MAVAGGNDVEARAREHAAGEFTHDLLVLDQQDRPLSLPFGRGTLGCRVDVALRGGQVNAEARTGARRTLHVNHAPVPAHDALDRGQSQPRHVDGIDSQAVGQTERGQVLRVGADMARLRIEAQAVLVAPSFDRQRLDHL